LFTETRDRTVLHSTIIKWITLTQEISIEI
jgi:hypothetical protein